MAAALTGCAGLRGGVPDGASEAVGRGMAAPARPAAADPIGNFLAAGGNAGEVPGAGYARVVRSYFAASGRECREVLLGSGMGERSSLYCDQGGVWQPARPLLRGGTWSP